MSQLLTSNPVAPSSRGTLAIALEGARDMTPMVIGIVPFGLALGATIGTSPIDPWVGLFSAPAILAGAAQLATLQMLDAGSNPFVIVASALLINVRIMLYSASLAPWFREAGLKTRLALAVAVIDQVHFVCTPRFEQGDLSSRERVGYYVGGCAWLISAWLGSQTIAVVLGAELPDAVRLDMAAPFALLGLLAKSLGERSALLAALVAGVIAGVGAGLPFQSVTLVATVVGIAAAMLEEARS